MSSSISISFIRDYTALQPRGQTSSHSPPWEPQILLSRLRTNFGVWASARKYAYSDFNVGSYWSNININPKKWNQTLRSFKKQAHYTKTLHII
jgi:hypothetical protein